MCLPPVLRRPEGWYRLDRLVGTGSRQSDDHTRLIGRLLGTFARNRRSVTETISWLKVLRERAWAAM